MVSNYNFLEKKLCGPILWMEFNCLEAAEPLRGESLLFTIQLPGFPGGEYYKKIKNLSGHQRPKF